MAAKRLSPADRIVRAGNRLADEWHMNLSQDAGTSAERALRRLANKLLREAFAAGAASARCEREHVKYDDERSWLSSRNH